MIDLFAIYICPNCGEVLEDRVFYHEEIDCEHDEVYPMYCCEKCHSEVKRKIVDGVECFQTVDHERWLWAEGFYDEEIQESGIGFLETVDLP